MKRRIYLASSWRNPKYPEALAMLRNAGHEVYDFRNPAPGNTGFAWADIDPAWKRWTSKRFTESLVSPAAVHGYSFDKDGLDWCDTCVLLLPCGKSAHLEAGHAIGQGKPTLIVLDKAGFEPELMYLLADGVVPNMKHMVGALAAMRHVPHLTYPDKELQHDHGDMGLWGCICGSGILGREYCTNEEGSGWRVECGCGLCGAWGDSAAEACLHWNLVIASLTGPYSMMELFYRRLIRIGKESSKDVSMIEKSLEAHVQGYREQPHE